MRPVALLFTVLAASLAQTPEELNFAKPIGELRDLPQDLPAVLRAEAARHLATRPKLTTSAEVAERARRFRAQLIANIGGLPEKTPLNARVVGTIERERFRIEKVIFESKPGLYVTASLYLPKSGRGPYPAILFPLGHEPGGKAHEAWQIALGSFATKGFVALAWDPAGQGERVQFYDAAKKASLLVQSTREHSMLGTQTLVVGESFARYTIHDGIRALDYLASRPEVDANRIGVTGNSGGGTHTAYLAAIDDRLKVAAPSCYITNWSRLLAQLGPQDAEQNLPPFLNLGYDFPDFLYAFAPKPYLVLSAIRDFFPIGGARATFSEARAVYKALGAAEKIHMVTADDGHGYTKPRRLAAYQWFSKWLKGVDDDGVEPEFPLATEAELHCTPEGQVGGTDVFTLNRERAASVWAARAADPVGDARRLSGYRAPAAAPVATHYGTIRKAGYTIEKFVYESEAGIRVPAILAVPDGAGKRAAVLYVHGDGKAAVGPKLEAHMAAGEVVMAIDMRGVGELAAEGRGNDPWLGDASNAQLALLLGRTMVGMRAADIVAGYALLARHPGVEAGRIRAVGIGRGAVPLLYAAAFEERLKKVEFEGGLESYRWVVETREPRLALEHVVPGAIRFYDLQDLRAVVNGR